MEDDDYGGKNMHSNSEIEAEPEVEEAERLLR